MKQYLQSLYSGLNCDRKSAGVSSFQVFQASLTPPETDSTLRRGRLSYLGVGAFIPNMNEMTNKNLGSIFCFALGAGTLKASTRVLLSAAVSAPAAGLP